jgi:asparagine synthase (glutamine-hydrolysing)
MCGIFGVLDLKGEPIPPGFAAGMGASIVHRGPDDEGLFSEGPCLIGMRRLSIIDLAGGHQPLSNKYKTVWLVCNGEIYNFRELRTELQARGHVFLTGSDCETIIHAYVEYGDEFVHKLNGMFGFALWDSRAKRLLIGRDRLGIKPIYLYNDGRRLAFASEAKSILALPGFNTALNQAALPDYLALGYVPAPLSIFQGITKLAPATILSVRAGAIREQRYWNVPARIDTSMTESQWAERVRAHLERSVQMQMVSDVPIGAFLSGGIDSSAVVAYMAKASALPIKTYSIGFQGSDADNFYNELPYAQRVAQLFHTEHREILVKPNVVELLAPLLWHMDEPIADTAFITTYLVSKFAREDVTVILSGVGGDELFGGYRRYLGDHYLRQFKRLPGWMRQSVIALGKKLPSDRHSGWLNLFRYAKGFLASYEQTFEQRYESYVEVFPDAQRKLLLKANGVDRSDALRSAFLRAADGDALNRMLVVDAETQLPDDLLLLTDKMTMATSLECRVPLLDHELVELAAAIPEGVKVKGGRLKHTMKEALAGVLPRDILDRKKRGFGTPMGAWLKQELAPLLRNLLSEQNVARRGLFNPAEVTALIKAHETNRIDGTDRLLALLNLEVWSRVFLDRQTAADVALQLKEASA